MLLPKYAKDCTLPCKKSGYFSALDDTVFYIYWLTNYTLAIGMERVKILHSAS